MTDPEAATLEPLEPLELAAALEVDPEAPALAPAQAITIRIPEGVRELTLDRATLELWLTLGEWQYRRAVKPDPAEVARGEAPAVTDALAAIIGAFKVFLRLAHFQLRRKRPAGWEEPPAKERGADILPLMLRYVAHQAFNDTVRRYPVVDLGALMLAQSWLAGSAQDLAQELAEEVRAYGDTGDTSAGIQDPGSLAALEPTTAGASRDAGTVIPPRAGSATGTPARDGSGGASGSATPRRRAIGLRRR